MPRARKTGGPTNRGGPRTGAPGKAYGNRTDLNSPSAAPAAPPAAAPAQGTMVQPRQYGGPKLAAPPVASPPSSPTSPVGQQQMPPAGGPPGGPPGAPPGSPPAGPPPPQGMQGNEPPPLMRPTDRPHEPLTAGAPMGPGPNSMQMPAPLGGNTLGLFLRALYRAQPSEDVRQLILAHEQKGQTAAPGPIPPITPPTPTPQPGAGSMARPPQGMGG